MFLSKSLTSETPDLALLNRFSRKDCLPLLTDEVWQIEQGIVRTLTWSPQGQITTLGLWGQGEIVGQLLTKIMPYQMECLTPVLVKALPINNYSQYWRDALLNHLWRTQELFIIIHQSSVPERLLALLHWLAQRFGQQVPEGQILEPILTHQELSEILSASRVTVTRLLTRLEEKGKLVRLKKRDEKWPESQQISRRKKSILIPEGYKMNSNIRWESIRE
jgi:CRP-like cAMP-binding protein